MSYDPAMFIGYMVGQGAYMRIYDAKPWGEVFRHVGLGLAVGIPVYLGIVWLCKHVRFA